MQSLSTPIVHPEFNLITELEEVSVLSPVFLERLYFSPLCKKYTTSERMLQSLVGAIAPLYDWCFD